MIVALTERDNIGGLAKGIDLLKDSDLLAVPCPGFQQIARQAWQTAIQAINNHQVKICESVLQIFKTTDVVANTWTRKCFTQIVATHCRGLGIVF